MHKINAGQFHHGSVEIKPYPTPKTEFFGRTFEYGPLIIIAARYILKVKYGIFDIKPSYSIPISDFIDNSDAGEMIRDKSHFFECSTSDPIVKAALCILIEKYFWKVSSSNGQ